MNKLEYIKTEEFIEVAVFREEIATEFSKWNYLKELDFVQGTILDKRYNYERLSVIVQHKNRFWEFIEINGKVHTIREVKELNNKFVPKILFDIYNNKNLPNNSEIIIDYLRYGWLNVLDSTIVDVDLEENWYTKDVVIQIEDKYFCINIYTDSQEEIVEMITEVFPTQTITYEKHFVAR